MQSSTRHQLTLQTVQEAVSTFGFPHNAICFDAVRGIQHAVLRNSESNYLGDKFYRRNQYYYSLHIYMHLFKFLFYKIYTQLYALFFGEPKVTLLLALGMLVPFKAAVEIKKIFC